MGRAEPELLFLQTIAAALLTCCAAASLCYADSFNNRFQGGGFEVRDARIALEAVRAFRCPNL